ncbi:unnamed protein product [Rotaria magnacalcarata]|uniref:Galectin n=1 Tax=Rotaria magnacalcarata TaxID=392030 RepID=A0A819S8K3_9BILA|nr:unnamed protein product [Rotaria magnacalcarata]CAF4055287.1 unnamed protein product [Rotaria magnacalcarata]
MFPNFSVHTGFGLPVPYETPISPSLSAGIQIHISGTPTGNQFEVNLKNQQDDIVLHFNPRFDASALILNSAQRGAWGQEQRQSLPMQRGVRFTLVIMATNNGFNIAVNNSHVCEFYQRVPMYLAQLVQVKGDINLESVQVYGGGMGSSMNIPPMGANMPFGQPSFGQPSFGQPSFGQPSFGQPSFGQPSFGQPSFGGDFNVGFGFPSAPVVVPTPSFPMGGGGGGVPSIQSCRIHPGSRIFVRGFIPPGAQRFELNLLQGYNDTDDIAFHFNPRFDARTIVKNHRRNGQWGQEENQPFPSYMPLMPGIQIDLQIACYPDKYTIFMNSQLIAEFYHKIPAGFVMALQYKGDITVTSVGQI